MISAALQQAASREIQLALYLFAACSFACNFSALSLGKFYFTARKGRHRFRLPACLPERLPCAITEASHESARRWVKSSAKWAQPSWLPFDWSRTEKDDDEDDYCYYDEGGGPQSALRGTHAHKDAGRLSGARRLRPPARFARLSINGRLI